MIDNAIVKMGYNKLMGSMDRLLSKHGVDIHKAPEEAILGCLVYLKSIEDTEAWQVEFLYAEHLANTNKQANNSKYIFEPSKKSVGRLKTLIKDYK